MKRKVFILATRIAVSVGLLFLAGCVATNRFADEVASERSERAHLWTREPSQAEELGPCLEGKLGLADALKLALAYNKELQAARREREFAHGRLLESYGQALPHVKFNAGYTRLDEVTSIDIGPQRVSLGFEDNYSAELTVRQPVFHGAAIPAALRVAKLYALWSDEGIRAALEGTIFQVTKAYYDWVLARQLAHVDEQAVKFAESVVEDVKRKREKGLASDYDVLRAEVELSNTRAQSIRSRNASDLALRALMKVIGASLHSRVDPVDELSYAKETVSREEAIRMALEKRPELTQAEYSLRMQREAVNIARSAYWPKLDAFFNYKWANPDPHSSVSDEWGDAWTVGLTLSLPIFDGFERRGKLLQEQARLAQAEIRLRSQEEAVAFEVEQAVLSFHNAEELVESQRMNLRRAEEGLRLVQAGYRQGTQSELALLDAQTALTRARALYYEALHAHIMARLNLRRATGTLLTKTSEPEAATTNGTSAAQVSPEKPETE